MVLGIWFTQERPIYPRLFLWRVFGRKGSILPDEKSIAQMIRGDLPPFLASLLI